MKASVIHQILLMYGDDVVGCVPVAGAATWNPADKSAAVTLSAGNLTYTGNGYARSVRGLCEGKVYWEILVNQMSGEAGGSWNVGFTSLDATLFNIQSSGYIQMAFLINGNLSNNSGIPGAGTPFVNGDTVCIAVDFSAKLGWFRKNNGNWNNLVAGNPATGVNGMPFVSSPGPYFPVAASSSASTSYTANFGATAFTFTMPSGFTSFHAS